jgi:Mg-chelatase subunit ChlD
MKLSFLPLSLAVLTTSAVIAYPQVKSWASQTLQPGFLPGIEMLTVGQSTVGSNLLPDQTAPARPVVEVVFVLDTTSSMTGLIQAAKENIWSIASTMASAQPAPELRMGLVAFRDKGDSYVTRVIDLSTDLDSMYAALMDFQAEGGGDGPEHVNQALYDAVNRVSWSQERNVYKVAFLVGDAPAHMDYQDDVKYPDTIASARQRGIVVNTILAGDDTSTAIQWKQMASLNQGEFFQVGQEGNAVAVVTPYDEQIAALSARLDDTRLFYGNAEKREALAGKTMAAEKLHAEGSVASRAKRALYNASPAGKANFTGGSELVEDVATGRVELDTVPSVSLPAPLQGLSTQEQQALLSAMAAERKKLEEDISTLSAQRQTYIHAELEAAGSAEQSLDHKIFKAVQAQAADKGMRYEDITY